jgi:hypothetical protein
MNLKFMCIETLGKSDPGVVDEYPEKRAANVLSRHHHSALYLEMLIGSGRFVWTIQFRGVTW